MEEEAQLFNDAPVAAPELWHPGGNGYYGPDSYPFQANYNNNEGQMYIKNPQYLIRLFDAAGFRLTANGDIELLVRDPEGTTLAWYDVTELDLPEATNH